MSSVDAKFAKTIGYRGFHCIKRRHAQLKTVHFLSPSETSIVAYFAIKSENLDSLTKSLKRLGKLGKPSTKIVHRWYLLRERFYFDFR